MSAIVPISSYQPPGVPPPGMSPPIIGGGSPLIGGGGGDPAAIIAQMQSTLSQLASILQGLSMGVAGGGGAGGAMFPEAQAYGGADLVGGGGGGYAAADPYGGGKGGGFAPSPGYGDAGGGHGCSCGDAAAAGYSVGGKGGKGGFAPASYSQPPSSYQPPYQTAAYSPGSAMQGIPNFGNYGAPSQAPGDVRGMIRWAAAQYGAKPDGLVAVANAESGFNTGIANNWDSNARRGTPSKGLFQFIEPTFRSMAPRARAANPQAWAGIGQLNWMDPKQQALTAAWAFSTGQGSHWTTRQHYARA